MSKLVDLIFDEAKEISLAVLHSEPCAELPAKLHNDIKQLMLDTYDSDYEKFRRKVNSL